LNTSWDKGAELLRRTINVFFGKTNSKFRLDDLLCRHDIAVTTKLMVKSAERSTKWCHLNDEKNGDNAVQRLNMLSNTAELKAYVTPTVIYGAWCKQRIKKERRPGFAQLNKPCCATQRPPPSPRGRVASL
jgi:hypothetical protein